MLPAASHILVHVVSDTTTPAVWLVALTCSLIHLHYYTACSMYFVNTDLKHPYLYTACCTYLSLANEAISKQAFELGPPPVCRSLHYYSLWHMHVASCIYVVLHHSSSSTVWYVLVLCAALFGIISLSCGCVISYCAISDYFHHLIF